MVVICEVSSKKRMMKRTCFLDVENIFALKGCSFEISHHCLISYREGLGTSL